MDARARLARPALLAVGLLAASIVGFQLGRSSLGVGFSSDSYSYLAWAERFVSVGELGHTPYDFTAPKPLPLAVATLGQALGAPIGTFGTWAVLSYFGAVLAAGALAKRFAGWPAALAAGAIAAVLPPLVRGGWSGDATVAYAACVVGAAALHGRVRPAAALLGLAGLLRPDAWGLAVVYAALSWRHAGREDRAIATAAAAVPPLLWLSFDWIATGDPLYGAHATDRYGVVAIPIQDLLGVLRHLVPELLTWPLLALGLAALVAGLRRCPLDPAVVFPVAMLAALLVEVQLGLIGAGPLGRYSIGVFLFLPAAAGIVLAQAPGRAKLPVLAVGTAVCIGLLVSRLDAIRDLLEHRGSVAAQLDEQMAPAVERAVGSAFAATEPDWGGALAVYSDVSRDRIVRIGAVGQAVPRRDVHAYLVLVGRQRGREEQGRSRPPGRVTARSTLWRLYTPG